MAPLLVLTLSVAAPAVAQQDPAPPAQAAPEAPFFDFLERMLRGFLTEVEPQMRELERGLESLEPELQGFLDRLRGMAQYHPPEVLPNGDILIRRRQAEDALPDDEEAPSSETVPFEL